jgi:predicted ATPase
VFSPEVAEFTRLVKKGITLPELQESTLDSRVKIALLYNCANEVFEKIKMRFIEIFPQVEDVRFVKPEREGLFRMFESIPRLEIKEKTVSGWIEQEALSSGMYKTFMHISEMYLWQEGTVVLIDEFENSLGVNCLDILTEDLLHENRRLQFIVTSHHPYIINNISPKHWKVVTRKGGVVSTQDASELRLDSSSHRAFTQLINREEFTEGISVS